MSCSTSWSEEVYLHDGGHPSISDHALQCTRRFQRYENMADVKFVDPAIIDDQRARFALWATKMDVFGPSEVSLDHKLRFHPTATDIIHQLLEVIRDSLDALKPSPGTLQKSDNKQQDTVSGRGTDTVGAVAEDVEFSGTDTDKDPVQENAELLTFNVGGTISQLFSLSFAARESAMAQRAKSIQEYTDDPVANSAIEQLRQYTERYMRVRFPLVPEFLCSAMIDANTWRLRRFYYQRSRTSKAAVLRTGAGAAFSSWLFTRLHRPTFPPLPGRSGCRYCGVKSEFEDVSTWHDHIVQDLEPFVCMFPHCERSKSQIPVSTTFGTATSWLSHMQNSHRSVWECRAPSHKPITFEDESTHQRHLLDVHDVTSAHVETLSEAARRPTVEKIMKCPFGDEFQPAEQTESGTLFSSEGLQRHVTKHLTDIALLVLQMVPHELDVDAEDLDGDGVELARSQESTHGTPDRGARVLMRNAIDVMPSSEQSGSIATLNTVDVVNDYQTMNMVNSPLSKEGVAPAASASGMDIFNTSHSQTPGSAKCTEEIALHDDAIRIEPKTSSSEAGRQKYSVVDSDVRQPHLVSTGIYVYGKFLRYYNRRRWYRLDIDRAYKQLKKTAEMFAQLNAVCDKDSYESKEAVYQALQPCQESLDKLKEVLSDFESCNIPMGMVTRFWVRLHRGEYPVSKDALSKVRELDTIIRRCLLLALREARAHTDAKGGRRSPGEYSTLEGEYSTLEELRKKGFRRNRLWRGRPSPAV